jgi:hypothetical protein
LSALQGIKLCAICNSGWQNFDGAGSILIATLCYTNESEGIRFVRNRRIVIGATAGAFSMLALSLSPAISASADLRSMKPRVSLGARGGLGAFTPATTDARLSALLARSGISSSGMRFTPASASVRLNRSVTVAVRARTMGNASGGERMALVNASTTAVMPVAYDLGLAVGWKRFALSGGVEKVDLGALGGRQAVDLGVSYSIKKFTTRVAVGSDRATPNTPKALAGDAGVSVAMSGSYSLTRNLDVTAGLKFRASDRDRLGPVVADTRRDSQAVYIGTAFKF